jgi:tetratricopeptide (TPR) repeat protein
MRSAWFSVVIVAAATMGCAASASTSRGAAQRSASRTAVQRAAPALAQRSDELAFEQAVVEVRAIDAQDDGRGAWSDPRCVELGARLEAVARRQPASRAADSWFAAAMTFDRCAQRARRDAALSRALSVNGTHCPSRIRSALALAERGAAEEAERALDRASLTCTEARIELARLLRAKHARSGTADASAAQRIARLLGDALFRDPENAGALHQLALFHLDAARLQGLIEPYTTVEQTCDRGIRVIRTRGIDGASTRSLLGELYNTRGQALLAKGRIAPALDSFRAATEYAPRAFEPWMNLGLLAIDARDYALAEPALARAVELSGDARYDALLALGIARRASLRFAAAIEAYEEARRLDPERPDAYFNLAVIHWRYLGGGASSVLNGCQLFMTFEARVDARGQRSRFERHIAIGRAECGVITRPLSSLDAVAAMAASDPSGTIIDVPNGALRLERPRTPDPRGVRDGHPAGPRTISSQR